MPCWKSFLEYVRDATLIIGLFFGAMFISYSAVSSQPVSPVVVVSSK